MITLPFFKKQRDSSVKAKREKQEKKEKKGKKQEKKEKLQKKEIKQGVGKSLIAFRVLKGPVISEKGTKLEKEGKYLFKVFSNAKKNDIKKAVEDLYKIKVDKVNTITIPRKKKKLGRTEGWKAGYKKAIVSLKKGEKIEVVSR